MLQEFDVETRFQLRARRGAGQAQRGLLLLDIALASNLGDHRLNE